MQRIVTPDPYTLWIEKNRDVLQELGNQWVALHPETGIVFHASSDDFDRWLDKLSDDERADLMILHTSMYALS